MSGEVKDTQPTKPKRGRPISLAPKSPRAEYMREYMPGYRKGIRRRAVQKTEGN